MKTIFACAIISKVISDVRFRLLAHSSFFFPFCHLIKACILIYANYTDPKVLLPTEQLGNSRDLLHSLSTKNL